MAVKVKQESREVFLVDCCEIPLFCLGVVFVVMLDNLSSDRLQRPEECFSLNYRFKAKP